MGNNRLACEHVAELIGAYNDDELSAETRHRVGVHLLGCADCSREVIGLRITGERLRSDAGDVIVSDAFRARALRALYSDNPHVAPDTDPAPVGAGQYSLPISI